jgi:hypothetical protein
MANAAQGEVNEIFPIAMTFLPKGAARRSYPGQEQYAPARRGGK